MMKAPFGYSTIICGQTTFYMTKIRMTAYKASFVDFAYLEKQYDITCAPTRNGYVVFEHGTTLWSQQEHVIEMLERGMIACERAKLDLRESRFNDRIDVVEHSLLP
jgi:hypothetical protein